MVAKAGQWHRESAAWRLIALGYLPWLAGLNLAWETAHVRLYTSWTEAPLGYIAFAIAHCTLGDLAIGVLALMLALIMSRAGGPSRWRWGRIALLTAAIGAGYTVASEWMNLTILRSWSYSEQMPTIEIAGAGIGLSPLLQWLVVPPLALSLARRIGT
ncbi:MAG: hypothetical protein HY661_04855 [Betaproteobacteria bacterium]|nr:hypothetical protein [Betaproteobacteria bacterium]